MRLSTVHINATKQPCMLWRSNQQPAVLRAAYVYLDYNSNHNFHISPNTTIQSRDIHDPLPRLDEEQLQ